MTDSLFSLHDKVAVVLGGTGGLGGAMAQSLARAGAKIAVVGRDANRGQQRVDAIRASGGTAIFQAADVLELASLVEAQKSIESQIGYINILVNAAGGNRPEATLPPGADFCKLPLNAWQQVFDLNLVGGVLLPCQAFGQRMLEEGSGSIINIASMSGMIPLSRVVAYSAAKAAVINLTQFLAREWGTKGIRVNAISPGFFPAEQNRALLYNPDGTLSARGQQIINHTPMARFGNADELGGVAVWLASDAASSFVTGQNIVVDGGFSSTTI
jgi:NAD(P)-dependent dehydrogenase (short-subunit alcohol dehydrogenase family)